MPDGGQHFPALVLNADVRPLSCFPLSLWSWQHAVEAVFLDRISVLSAYDLAMRLPSVTALKDYIPATRKPAFTRFNVFLRDAFAGQYCSGRFPTQDLAYDHVIPRSRGGRTAWRNVTSAGNIVLACVQGLRKAIHSVAVVSAIVIPVQPRRGTP